MIARNKKLLTSYFVIYLKMRNVKFSARTSIRSFEFVGREKFGHNNKHNVMGRKLGARKERAPVSFLRIPGEIGKIKIGKIPVAGW